MENEVIELSRHPEIHFWSRLRPRQRRYIEARLSGKHPYEAYSIAFKLPLKTEDDKFKLWNKAMELERIKAVRDVIKLCSRAEEERLLELHRCSLGTHLRDLEKIRDRAVANKEFTPAVKAEELRAKAAGVYVERIQHDMNISFREAVRQLEGEFYEAD